MSDSASLEIKVVSNSVEDAQRRLDKLEKSGKDASRATDGLTASFKKFLVPLAGAISLTKLASDLIAVQRGYDVLSATLQTVTGSAEAGAEVFKVLQEYANITPYAINDLNEAFIKLVNYGLDPSERALTSYGNTASALGKNITDMVNAVASATTGEFDALKSFGIKAKNEGDTIAFSFKGITTSVKNNSEEIEGYLMKLGETDFAGAMENRLGKLDDTILAFGEQWEMLLLKVSQAGVGQAIQDSVQFGVDALIELNDMMESGQLEAALDAVAGKFDNWGKDVEETIKILTRFYKDNLSEFEDEGQSTVDFLIGAFRDFPENVRAFIQIATVEILSLFDSMVADAKFAKDSVKAIFTDSTIKEATDKWNESLENINKVRMDSIEYILQERDASKKKFDEDMANARKLREEFEKDREARRAGQGDRLAQYKIESDQEDGPSKADIKADKKRQDEFKKLQESLLNEEEALKLSYDRRKKIIESNTADGSSQRDDLMSRLDKEYSDQLEKLKEAKGKELESLRSSLRSEEESIQESYDRRMKIIRDNTLEGSTIREELAQKVQAERDKELSALEQSRQRERDSLYNGLLTEEEMLRQSYERRKEAILESEVVTAEERMDLMKRLEEQYATEQAAAETKRIQGQLATAGALFDGLAGLAKAYGGEQSKAYRALFAVSKAFSVAQAAMSISTGLAKAQELGFPANLAEMARVAATGAGILSQINGSNFSGAYDKGGNIPAGKIGLVGEYGPELMEGPAKITSRAETARMLKEGGESSSSPAPQVNQKIINVLDPSVVGDYLATDDGEELIMNVVQRNQRSIGG